MNMQILDKSEHQKCLHYEKETPPTVETKKIEKGHEEEMIFNRNGIIFMMSGEVGFIFPKHPEKILRKGEFIFIPVGGLFRFVVSKTAQMIIIRPNGNVKLCASSLIEKLYKNDTIPPKDNKPEICALVVNRPLQSFLDGLDEAIKDGLMCRYYFDTKANELFILLKAYYTREQLRDFFSLILSPNTIFSEYIRANHHKYATTKELAVSMNMTPKIFSKKFIRVFGEFPTDWMRKEKAIRVYSELYTGQESIAQIADNFKFSSQSHLNKFCKREFGKNPGQIRKGG